MQQETTTSTTTAINNGCCHSGLKTNINFLNFSSSLPRIRQGNAIEVQLNVTLGLAGLLLLIHSARMTVQNIPVAPSHPAPPGEYKHLKRKNKCSLSVRKGFLGVLWVSICSRRVDVARAAASATSKHGEGGYEQFDTKGREGKDATLHRGLWCKKRTKTPKKSLFLPLASNCLPATCSGRRSSTATVKRLPASWSWTLDNVSSLRFNPLLLWE